MPQRPRRSKLAAALVARASVPYEAKAPLLELRGVHAGYGQARVLEGIDLRVERAAPSPSSAPTAPARRRWRT